MFLTSTIGATGVTRPRATSLSIGLHWVLVFPSEDHKIANGAPQHPDACPEKSGNSNTCIASLSSHRTYRTPPAATPCGASSRGYAGLRRIFGTSHFPQCTPSRRAGSSRTTSSSMASVHDWTRALHCSRVADVERLVRTASFSSRTFALAQCLPRQREPRRRESRTLFPPSGTFFAHSSTVFSFII